MATVQEKKLNGAGVVLLWNKVKNLIGTAGTSESDGSGLLGGLWSLFAKKAHTHTKSEISDLKDATDSKGGLMTDAQAVKLAGIAAGAEANVIRGIQRNGADIAPDATSKKVNIAVPVKISELSNDDNTVKDASYVHTDNNFTSEQVQKLGGIAAGAQVNVIEAVKVNGTAVSVSGKAVNITVPTDNASLANGAGYQTEQEVVALIDSKLTSAVIPKGSSAFASLPTPGKANLGWLYNVTDDFTTTAAFVEGAGKAFSAGTNVYVVQVDSSTYKWDVMQGFIDLSAYAGKDDVEALSSDDIDAICV